MATVGAAGILILPVSSGEISSRRATGAGEAVHMRCLQTPHSHKSEPLDACTHLQLQKSLGNHKNQQEQKIEVQFDEGFLEL